RFGHIHTDKGTFSPLGSRVDSAGDEFLAGASLSRNEHGGVCGSHPANPGTSRLQRRGGTDNLLEHEAFFDLVPQSQILPIEAILERPDLCVSMLLLAQVERKRHAFVPSCVTQGSADQPGTATTP